MIEVEALKEVREIVVITCRISLWYVSIAVVYYSSSAKRHYSDIKPSILFLRSKDYKFWT